MVKGAVLGFAAGIVIVIFLGRFGLFRRDNRIHNVIASGDLTVSDVVTVARSYVGDRFDEYVTPNMENRSGFTKGLARIFRSALLEILPRYIGSRIESMTAGALDISRERLTDIWNTDIRTALKNGLVSDIIRSEIAKRFAALRRIAIIALSLLLLPPILETAVSLRCRRKRAAAENS
jgi:hypothetical protein